MPVLNQFECYIQLAESGLRLNEYDTWWNANAVECYVAIPNQPSPFKILLKCNGYVAPALSAYIYMDGVYQCNRFKQGLQPPENGRKLENAKEDMVFNAKEYYLHGNRQIQHPWRFEKLNVVAANAVGKVDAHALQNLGVIEVVILRCSTKRNDPPRPSSPASHMSPSRPSSPVPSFKNSPFWESPRMSGSVNQPKRVGIRREDGTIKDCILPSRRDRRLAHFAGGFDGPSDSREDDNLIWQVDGRGVDPPRRREGYYRSHTRGKYNSNPYDKARRSGHYRNNSDDFYGDDYCDTDSCINDFALPRQSRSYYRRDDDIPRRSHRHRARSPTPPRNEHRSYPREHDHRRSGRNDRELEAFRAGIRIGTERAQNSRSGDVERERLRRYRGTSPSPSNIPVGPSVVINQFPGGGQGVQVENLVDPCRGIRYTRDVADDEPIGPLRVRELSPTPAPKPRRPTDENLYHRLKSLLVEHEKEEPEPGHTSKRSSFHSYLEDAVDEEHGGKPSTGNDKKGEPMDGQVDGGDVADFENFAARFPMPGAYPSSTPSPIPPMAPKGLLEEPKRGFEAAMGQTKAPSPRVYGKIFSPFTPTPSKANDSSQRGEDPDSTISSWVERTQQALFSSLQVEAKGQESTNHAADIDFHPKVSFEDRGRCISRRRSPHHGRGVSHDRRRCSVCERYRRHREREQSREIHIWDDQGNDGWDNEQQSNNGNFSLFTFNKPKPAESKTDQRHDQRNWDSNNQKNDQNNWNSNDQQNDWANSTNQNTGWDNSNNRNDSGWDNSNNNDNNNWDNSNQNNSGWKNDNKNSSNWDSANQNSTWDSNQNNHGWANSNQNNNWDTTQNNQAIGNSNPWTNNPPPPPANWNSLPVEPEKKPDAPKSADKSHPSKEEIESISKPRDYWCTTLRYAGGAAQDAPSTPNSSKKRTDGPIMPAERLHTVPESAAKAKNMEHQVRGGEGIETSVPAFTPDYWDTMDKPYMVFRFRYRSRKCLEAILGEKITETTEELKDRLQGLTKDELIEEVVRRKDPDDDEPATEKKMEGEKREDGAIVPDCRWD